MARVSPRRAAQLPEILSGLEGLTPGLPLDEQVYAEEMQRMRQEDTGRGESRFSVTLQHTTLSLYHTPLDSFHFLS